MYDVYGIAADTYADACAIAGCDGPGHNFDEEFAYYEFCEIKHELGGMDFATWYAAEERRAGPPAPMDDLPY